LLPATLVLSTSSTPTLLTSTLARVSSAWDFSLTLPLTLHPTRAVTPTGGLGNSTGMIGRCAWVASLPRSSPTNSPWTSGSSSTTETRWKQSTNTQFAGRKAWFAYWPSATARIWDVSVTPSQRSKQTPKRTLPTCTGFNYGSQNAGAPDLCWARKPNVKKGTGGFAEQYIHQLQAGKSSSADYLRTDRVGGGNSQNFHR
jgi:hypothetical protein